MAIETEFVHHGLWSPWIDYSRSGILRMFRSQIFDRAIGGLLIVFFGMFASSSLSMS